MRAVGGWGCCGGAPGSGSGTDPVSEQIEEQLEGLLALAGQPEIPEDVIRVLQRARAETADGSLGAAAAAAMNLDFGSSVAALSDDSAITTSQVPVVAATADKSAAVVTEPTHVATSSASGVDVPSQPSQGTNDKSLSTPATGNIVSDVVPPGKPDVDKDISNATQQVGCAC